MSIVGGAFALDCAGQFGQRGLIPLPPTSTTSSTPVAVERRLAVVAPPPCASSPASTTARAARTPPVAGRPLDRAGRGDRIPRPGSRAVGLSSANMLLAIRLLPYGSVTSQGSSVKRKSNRPDFCLTLA